MFSCITGVIIPSLYFATQPRDRPFPFSLSRMLSCECQDGNVNPPRDNALPGTIVRRRSDSVDARLQRLELRVCDIILYGD